MVDVLPWLPVVVPRVMKFSKNKPWTVPSTHRAVVKHSIIHRALLDFLQHCDEESRVVSSFPTW